MRKALLGMTALAALTSIGTAMCAQAADLPYRKGPPPAPFVPPPVFTWTGFYIGAQVGGGFGGSDRVGINETATFEAYHNVGNVAPNGIYGGGTLGYNWQMSNLVIGVAGDLFASGLEGSATTSPGFASGGFPADVTFHSRDKVNWFGTGRLRLGWALDRWLLYATGGVAFGDFKYSITADSPTFGTVGILRHNSTRIGYTAGAGVEYAFTDHWTVNVEYRFTNFGRKTGHSQTVTPAFSTEETPNWHAVQAGINYKF